MMKHANREIQVQPLGWQDAPETETFQLSDMDHTMPKIYALIGEVFELPDGSDREVVVANMTRGLEFSLSQFPILAGVLEMDADNGRMWVSKRRESAVILHVKYMLEEDEYPSYATLEAKDFPAALVDGNRILPRSVTEKQLFSPLGDNDAKDTIIATFQINFIKGGLVLGVAIHHNCSDGPGCDGFLTTWAEAAIAARDGKPFVTIDPVNLDRSQLIAKSPGPERFARLDRKFPVLKDNRGPPPPPPADFKMPELAIRMWHFPKSSLTQLKEDCSPRHNGANGTATTNGHGETWISTYDAIMTIVFKTITRSKIPLVKPDMSKEVILVHALNTRGKYEPALPPRYLGNAIALPRMGPTPVGELVAPGKANLPGLAAAVRASIRAIDAQYVAELPEWVAGLEDRRWIVLNMHSFLGLDLAGTSWNSMRAYEAHDFGFGLPRALRWPNPSFEGYAFVYPSRAAVKPDAPDEGVEVCICLEKGCHDRLMEDEELLEYAQPRGV